MIKGIPVRLSNTAIGALVAIVVISALAFFWEGPVSFFAGLTEQHPYISGVVYVLWIFITTVLAPMATAPVIPIASAMLGPIVVAVLSVVGWTAGAVVAFLIARRYGKPLFARTIGLNSIEWYERRVPPHLEFITLVFLRMVIPVDVLSYAVGLFSTMSLFRYTLATFLGVIPFSFLFAFGGSALFEGRYVFLVLVSGSALVLFTLVWQILGRISSKDGE